MSEGQAECEARFELPEISIEDLYLPRRRCIRRDKMSRDRLAETRELFFSTNHEMYREPSVRTNRSSRALILDREILDRSATKRKRGKREERRSKKSSSSILLAQVTTNPELLMGL